MIAELDIEEKNQFPTGYDTFEVHTLIRRVQYKLREIKEGEIFGHQELVDLIKW